MDEKLQCLAPEQWRHDPADNRPEDAYADIDLCIFIHDRHMVTVQGRKRKLLVPGAENEIMSFLRRIVTPAQAGAGIQYFDSIDTVKMGYTEGCEFFILH